MLAEMDSFFMLTLPPWKVVLATVPCPLTLARRRDLATSLAHADESNLGT
jgi:hypothetical protein